MMSSEDVNQQVNGFIDFFYTLFTFIITSCSIAMMTLIYIVMNLLRDSCVNYLQKKFPDLEFVKETTLRSATDTHRNMGIITILVTLKGSCDPLVIKNRLMEDILEKRQNDGRYVYRHLRMALTTRWGWYAWQKVLAFNVDNHFSVANTLYRGRPITDSNIQECVSETVSKYLVPEYSPWHITVFQNLTAEKYYLLIRFHHMLLSHGNINLGGLLNFSKTKREISAFRSEIFDENDEDLAIFTEDSRRTHPFQGLYKTPKALPILFEKIYEACINNWNEFLSVYDPTENPSILKKSSLKTIAAIILIAVVAISKQLITYPRKSAKIIRNGLRQKSISLSLILRSLWKTLNPFSVFINTINGIINILVLIIFKLPLFLAGEFRSFCMRRDEKYTDSSYLKIIMLNWVLLREALKEVFYYLKMFYNGPRVILEELLLANKHSRHQLQFVSLCGRKVVSWSDPVPIRKICEIKDVTGASVSEILISTTSASLRDLLVQYSLDIPDTLHTTARYFPQDQLFQCQNRFSSPCGSGILCLPLPIRNPFGLEYDPVTELRAVQQIVLRARIRQPALYVASLSQLQYGMLTQILPSPILRLILNVLSRRFPVILTEVGPSECEESKKQYLWGQEVEDLMYWKPPQANICISLTLMRFGDYVKLGVMADALLSPHHTVITSTFAQHVWELAAASGVSGGLENFSYLTDDSDTPRGSRSSCDSTMSSSSLDLNLTTKNYSDDENNFNQDEPHNKYPLIKKLQFNIPS